MVFDGALEEAKIIVVMSSVRVSYKLTLAPTRHSVEFALLGSQVFVELVVNNLRYSGNRSSICSS